MSKSNASQRLYMIEIIKSFDTTIVRLWAGVRLISHFTNDCLIEHILVSWLIDQCRKICIFISTVLSRFLSLSNHKSVITNKLINDHDIIFGCCSRRKVIIFKGKWCVVWDWCSWFFFCECEVLRTANRVIVGWNWNVIKFNGW